MSDNVIHPMDPISAAERPQQADTEALCCQITEKDPGYFDRLADLIIAEAEAEGVVFQWKNCLGCLPLKTSCVMSDFQNKLDRSEITPQEFFDAWDREMEEKERLHPGFSDQMYEYLMAKYPGPGVDADEFFGLEESGQVPGRDSGGVGRENATAEPS
jgi:hypothetical protein